MDQRRRSSPRCTGAARRSATRAPPTVPGRTGTPDGSHRTGGVPGGAYPPATVQLVANRWRSQQPRQPRRTKPFPLVEVEVTAVADLENGGPFIHADKALVLIVKGDVDLQFAAQAALVAQGPGEVQFV